ncbi:MAG: TonB-dependent receptor [Emcibacter sp.]|nr:TonB-dependent receptor [Emcibacter sp.]
MKNLKSSIKSLMVSSTLRKSFLNTSTAVAIALASTTIFSIQAEAQTTTSVLRVHVIDAAGLDLAGVSITILHVPTGRTFDRLTNNAGILVAKGLPVGGPYVVRLTDESRVMKDAPVSINNIQLKLGESEAVTLLANRGSAAGDTAIEEIVVTSARVLTALRTGAGRNFSRDTIEGIASISRDFVSVLETDSKILVDDSVPRGPAVSIAGANFRFNSVTIDGVAQNDNFGLSLNASATQRAPISMDAIEAINVNIAPFDVTYGNFLGGNINIVTKSGTNEFHGSAYGFYTNDGLTGNTSRGQDLAIGDFNEKTYGATLGGPIIEDKLFFFAAYEKFTTTRPANSQTIENIPGVTQADVDRAIGIFKDVYGFDPGQFATTDDDKDEKILLKLDWNINDSHRASLTYQRASGDTIFDDFPELAILNSGRYNVNERLNSYSFQLFSDWTDSFSTEVKIGYKDVKNRQVSIDSSTPDFLIILPTGGQIAAGGDRFRQRNTLDNTSRVFRLKADYTLDDHTITAGFEQERNSVENFFLPYSRGQVQFGAFGSPDPLQDLADRNPDFILFGGSNSGVADDAAGRFTLTTNTLYLQDEWLVTDSLTLKFGIRYDWMTNGDQITFNQNFVDRNGFDNTENLDGKDLFLPRFGFNWLANDRLTVRGGVGLFGGGTPMIMLSNSYSGNGITRTFAGFFAPFNPGQAAPFANAIANLPDADAISNNFQQFLGVNPNSDVDALSPDFELLSSWKYNLALEYVLDLSSLGLGDDWDLTLEAIYTDVKNGYDIYEARRQVIGTAPDGRPIYSSHGFNDSDYIVINTSQGSSTVISFDIAKSFDTNFGYVTTTLGYTHQDVEDVRSYNRFVGFETFAFDPQRDLNNPDLSTSRFEIPNRITATLSWEKEIWGENKTRLGLVYTGRSGRNFSYIFNGTGTFGGSELADQASPDNPGPNLFYVPSGLNDPLITGDAGFLAGLDQTISGDSCLSKYRGGIIPRNACTTGWVNQINLHFSQEIEIVAGHKVEFILDIENFGNLINSNWGRLDAIFQPSNVPLANVAISGDGSQYVLSESGSVTATAANPNIARIPSAYRIQFGIRYRF